MLTIDQLAEIVDTPGRLMGLFRKHDKVPGTGDHSRSDCARCALEIIAIEYGIIDWLHVLPIKISLAFSEGFDEVDFTYSAGMDLSYEDLSDGEQAYELGRRARIACGLEPVKQ